MSTASHGRTEHNLRRGFSLIELMIVVTAAVIVTAMAIPVFSSIVRNLRGDGDLRALSSDTALAKMRAAASFSRARLRTDLTARSFQVEVWNKTTNSWAAEGGTQSLSNGVNFGFGSITSPPPNTQASIDQAAACQTDAQTVANAAGNVANTACIVFNSRGVPVDSTGAPTGNGAFYVNDGASAQSVTVGATGLIRTWRRDLVGSSSWRGR